MIETFHVTKTYEQGDRPAIREVSLKIDKGEFVFLTGPSGAGKSTLLKMIFAAEEPTSGQILVNGRNVARLKRRQIPYLRREIGVNYRATNPASATIEVNAVTPEVLAAARKFPGIGIAEARGVVEARAKVGDDWMRMLLFVVDDFDAMRLNTFTRDSGAWPPPPGTLLVERQAVPFLGQGEGGSLTIRTPHGAPRRSRC